MMFHNQTAPTKSRNSRKRSRGVSEHEPRKKEKWTNCLGKSLFGCSTKGGVSNFVCESCRTRKIPVNRARLTEKCKCFVYENGKKVSGVSAVFFEDVAGAPDGEAYNLVVFPTSREALFVSKLGRFRNNFSRCEVISDRCGTGTGTGTGESTWKWSEGISLRIDRTNHKLLPRKLKMDTSNKSNSSVINTTSNEEKNVSGTDVSSSESPEVAFVEIERLLAIIKKQKLSIEGKDRTIKKQKKEIEVLTRSQPFVSVPVYSLLEHNPQLDMTQTVSLAQSTPDLWT